MERVLPQTHRTVTPDHLSVPKAVALPNELGRVLRLEVVPTSNLASQFFEGGMAGMEPCGPRTARLGHNSSPGRSVALLEYGARWRDVGPSQARIHIQAREL
jgi:hypothetical protein